MGIPTTTSTSSTSLSAVSSPMTIPSLAASKHTDQARVPSTATATASLSSSTSSSSFTPSAGVGVVSTSSALHSSPAFSTTSISNSAIAGYVAGIVGVVVGHPFDSAIVWLQTNSTGQNKHFAPTARTRQRPSNPNTPAKTSTSSSSSSSSNSNSCRSKGGSRVLSSSSSSSSSNATSSTSTSRILKGRSQSSLSMAAANSHHRGVFSSSGTLLRSFGIPTTRIFGSHTASLQAIRALYSGAAVPLATVGILGSLNFTLYDSFRRILYERKQQQQQQQNSLLNLRHDSGQNNPSFSSDEYLTKGSLQDIALSGFMAGAIVSIFTTPISLTKVRQQVTGNGFRETVHELFVWSPNSSLATPSLSGSSSSGGGGTPYNLVRGLGPHLVWGTVGRAMYYATYEYGKRTLMTWQQHPQQSSASLSSTVVLSIPERMVCAGLSGMLCCSVLFPIDSLRSRWFDTIARQTTSPNNHHTQHQHKHKHKLPKITSSLQLARIMLYEHGSTMSLRSFYRGFGLSVVRAGPVAAAVLPMYDLVLDYLSSSSSSSM